jgi:hypothetical protein
MTGINKTLPETFETYPPLGPTLHQISSLLNDRGPWCVFGVETARFVRIGLKIGRGEEAYETHRLSVQVMAPAEKSWNA